MIQLLVLAAEVVAVMMLLFDTPLRRVAVVGLDWLKRGRGPLAGPVAGTALIVLGSSAYSIAKIKIKSRGSDLDGGPTLTDQVLMSGHLLEASLMGYSLFLLLIINRLHQNARQLCSLHQYAGELFCLRKNMEALKNQNDALERAKHYDSYTVNAQDIEIQNMKDQIKQLMQESAERLKTAEANARELHSLRKSMEAVTKQNRSLEEEKSFGSSTIKARDLEIENMKAQIKQLKQESGERLKEVNTAETSAIALKKQSKGFLLEYDRLLEDNQNLRNQLRSMDRRFSHADAKKTA